jgi:hypothetical protein
VFAADSMLGLGLDESRRFAFPAGGDEEPILMCDPLELVVHSDRSLSLLITFNQASPYHLPIRL